MAWVYIVCFHISTIELEWDVMDDAAAIFVIDLYLAICLHHHKPIPSC